MPPDRRFGLPNPLEDDSSEKKGLWGSLKRVFGVETPSPPDPAPAMDATPLPLPAAPAWEAPPPPAVPAPRPVEPRVSATAEVPFLDEPSVAEPGLVSRPAKTEEASPASAAPPRLARGLASFSKSNAEREKRFAHILRDSPGGKKKPPGSGR